MSIRVLVLRPQPGADRTASRAAAIGLDPVLAPLFTVHALPWSVADPDRFDALMLTSANGARAAASNLRAVSTLPCYAVGEATAAAAQAGGLQPILVGSGDGAALVHAMERDGVRAALHLCGRDRTPLPPTSIAIEAIAVYAAEAISELPVQAQSALTQGALALLHSQRAARLFARLLNRPRAGVSIAALSPAVAAAAGTGWRHAVIADKPRDDALLELAAELCKTAGQGKRGSRR